MLQGPALNASCASAIVTHKKTINMTPFSKSTPECNRSDGVAAGEPERIAGGATSARILVVEDDFLISLELEHRLIDAGFNVVGIAVTAGEAVSIAGSQGPDLAVMDIRLADRTDGVEAAIELFTTLGIRSIFVSAHADVETRKRAAPASPVGWLQKPYPAEALIRLIRAHLSVPSA